MEKSVSKISRKLNNAKKESYYRRINWLPLLERIKLVSEEVKKANKVSYIGEFYFRTNEEEYKSSLLNNYIKRLNSAQFWIGNKPVVFHNLRLKNNKNAEIRQALEGNAALVFSQNADGRITIFLYPMRCELVESEKEPKVLAFKSPNDLTISKLRKYFRIYLKYIYVTSIDSRFSFCNFKFRLCLKLRDFIIRLSFKEYFETLFKTLSILGVIATIISTILAIWVYIK